MSNQRAYLMFEDISEDKSLIPYFERCVEEIQKGGIRVSKTRAKAGYPSFPCFRIEGREILVDAVLEYYLFQLEHSGFISARAEDFSEKMRILCGWEPDVQMALRRWIEDRLRDPFFFDVDDNEWSHKWVLRSEKAEMSEKTEMSEKAEISEKNGEFEKLEKAENPEKLESSEFQLSQEHFKFACYIAVCFTKYGFSFDKIFSDEIFFFVTALGSSLPAQIKKHGSGLLPKEICELKTKDYSCVANDAFATIKLSVKKECSESYCEILDFMCRLLEFGFPKSYSIEFKSPNKIYLPIKNIAKKGINQLFANAILYPQAYEKIQAYARLAMNESQWYQNLEGASCAMPGTFAVFALGLQDEAYHELLCDYLCICDGEHQSIHGDFVLAYIEKYGFTQKAKQLYELCEKNIQHLPKKLLSLYQKENKTSSSIWRFE